MKISLFAFAVFASLTAGVAWAGLPPPTTVPEPGTLALLALGIAGIAVARLGRRK